jgi:hypothetical protein
MSENQEEGWRLKKAQDGLIVGPLPKTRIKELAETALIAPEDFIDQGDDKWVRAPEVDYLEMDWMVETKTGQSYGPTTAGTVRDFYGQGDVDLEDEVVHVKTANRQKIGAFLQIDLNAPPVLGEEAGDPDTGSEGGSGKTVDQAVLRNLEMAKDLRIRQLETDLEKLRSEHESLLQKFRKKMEQAKTDNIG